MKKTKSGYIGLLENDWINVKDPNTRKTVKLYRIIALRTFQIQPAQTLEELRVIEKFKEKKLIDLEKSQGKIDSLKGRLDNILKTKVKESSEINRLEVDIEREKFKQSQIKRELAKVNINTHLEVKIHTIGGYVESLDNLDELNPVWIDNNSKVLGKSKVLNGSHITNNVKVYDHAVVDNSRVSDYVKIHGNAQVRNSFVGQLTEVRDNSIVESSFLLNSAICFGDATVENSILEDGSIVRGKSKVTESIISDISQVQGESIVDKCVITGRYCVDGETVSDKELFSETELSVSKGY